MKVYVLVCNYANVDSGDFNTEVIGVYDNFDKAQKIMEQHKKEIRNDYDYCDVEENESDGYWSICEQGYWVSNHCTLSIQVKEIK